ncbi:MAG: zf-HC2 domain-containing protein, partial [Oscillospiraceae bacterium]|nr:zf-HC2 domain-containing protein [Oscillospiraceae bacterium]
MTDCAKIQELISAMLDGELSAEEKSLVKEHIDSCSECAAMYEMFALVSGELESDLAEAPADLKNKVMAGIKPEKKKKGLIVSLRPYMTAAACLVLVIGVVAAGRGGFSMNSAADMAAPRAAAPESAIADTAEEPMAPMAPMAPMQDDSYSYGVMSDADVPSEESAPACAEPSAEAQAVYYGTLVDRAMSKVDENDLTGRAYIGVEFDDGTGEIFWLAHGYELPEGIALGDRVEIESDIEQITGLLIATRVSLCPDQSGIIYYCMDWDSELISPTVALYDNGEFTIIFSAFSSYIATGTYEFADSSLI